MDARSKYRAALTASSIYLVCEGLRIAGGFISMPVLTRALSVEEYGLLNLSFATVGILALLGRLGFAEAATRFYFDFKQQGPRALREFCATMLTGSFLCSLAVMLVAVLVLQRFTSSEHVRRCLQMACVLVVLRAVLGVVAQVYRAQERPIAFSIAQVATRYASLVMVIALALLDGISAYRVIVATIVAEGLMVLGCLTEFASRGVLGRPTLAPSHVSAAFSYGTPLALGLYATFFLDYGDRFLIERFLGLGAVALYSVPYDLVSALAAAIFGSLKLALMPVIFRVWESEGPSATQEFVSRMLTYALSLAIPATALYIVTSEDLILFLTSAKYQGSGMLTAYLVPGVVLGELNFLVAAGLLLSRNTVTLAGLSVACCVLNLGLNMVLLPRWGIAGAACATTITYLVLMVTTYMASRSALALRVQPIMLAASVVTTAVLLLSLSKLGQVSGQPFVNLLVRGGVGAGIVVVSMSLLSPEIRRFTWMRMLGKPSLRSVG